MRSMLSRAVPFIARSFSTAPARRMASPFTRAVVSSMRQLYPEALADQSFDNTGLLLEAPFFPQRRNRNSVLLTIDLTKAVADEAIEERHSVVVAYHPIIFRGLKALTLDDSQQQSLLRLAAHGISVYSPHTAVDTVPGGMADWLCDIVTGKLDPSTPDTFTAAGDASPASETDVTTTASSPESPQRANSNLNLPDPFLTPKPKRPSTTHRTYSKPLYPHPRPDFHPDALPHTRSIITPSPTPALDAANHLTNSTTYTPTNTGAGRLIHFHTPQPLSALVTRIAHATGLPKGFPLAVPQSLPLEHLSAISTVAVCPGAGFSVIRRARPWPPDLSFTGEIPHHDALATTEAGGAVLALFHSNSERGYLAAVLQHRLFDKLCAEWEALRARLKSDASSSSSATDKTGNEGPTADGATDDILDDDAVEVVMSKRDRDPFGIVVMVESDVEGLELAS